MGKVFDFLTFGFDGESKFFSFKHWGSKVGVIYGIVVIYALSRYLKFLISSEPESHLFFINPTLWITGIVFWIIFPFLFINLVIKIKEKKYRKGWESLFLINVIIIGIMIALFSYSLSYLIWFLILTLVIRFVIKRDLAKRK